MKLSEHDIQTQIVEWCGWNHILVFSVPNGVYFNTNQFQAANYMRKLKAECLLVGASDLVIVLKNKTLYVECKSAKGKQSKGKQSKEQVAFQYQVEELGHEYVVWRSLDDCVDYFKKKQ